MCRVSQQDREKRKRRVVYTHPTGTFKKLKNVCRRNTEAFIVDISPSLYYRYILLSGQINVIVHSSLHSYIKKGPLLYPYVGTCTCLLHCQKAAGGLEQKTITTFLLHYHFIITICSRIRYLPFNKQNIALMVSLKLLPYSVHVYQEISFSIHFNDAHI